MRTVAVPWYQVENIDQVDTPALLFYPERIKENIAIAKKIIGDVNRLRPHVKTHKCTEVTRLMLDAGITKFKCATIAEAEMLAISGAPDVLLAYQPVLIKLHRFLNLIKQYRRTRFSCLADNAASAAMMSAAAAEAGEIVNIFIDINTGMNRTGILPAGVTALYTACLQLKGISVKGLHAYDGHIYTPDIEQRTKECLASFSAVQELADVMAEMGYVKPVIVAGGTPTFTIFAGIDEVECSPGTFVLWDDGYGKLFPDMPFLPAAVVVTRVVSVPDDYTACVDLGHKGIAAENTIANRVRFLNAPDVTFISHSEEHLLIKTIGQRRFNINDVLYGVPVHICPTCALYDRAAIVTNHEAVGEWKIIARNRMINF